MTEVKLVGNNNTKVKVTNKEELLVKIGDIDSNLDLAKESTLQEIHNQLPSSIGPKNMANSISVTMATNENQGGATPHLLITTTSGAIAVTTTSVGICNTGTANAVVLGQVFKPGLEIHFNPGNYNTYAANSFTYDATGTELTITYNT